MSPAVVVRTVKWVNGLDDPFHRPPFNTMCEDDPPLLAQPWATHCTNPVSPLPRGRSTIRWNAPYSPMYPARGHAVSATADDAPTLSNMPKTRSLPFIYSPGSAQRA